MKSQFPPIDAAELAHLTGDYAALSDEQRLRAHSEAKFRPSRWPDAVAWIAVSAGAVYGAVLWLSDWGVL